MAYVEFEGPDGQGGRVVTRKTIPDEAMAAFVEAVCVNDNYVGETPGLYTIDRVMHQWRHEVTCYKERIGAMTLKEEVAAALAPFDTVTTTVNGVDILPEPEPVP